MLDAEIVQAVVKTVHDNKGKHMECDTSISVWPHLLQIKLSRKAAAKLEEVILEDVEDQVKKMYLPDDC